jgi:hypothetical protein
MTSKPNMNRWIYNHGGAQQAENLKEQIFESQIEARKKAIEELKLDYGDALEELEEIDPDGWETWYDNCQEIPEVQHWTESAARPVINVIKARAVLITDARAMVERTGKELDLAIEKAQAGSIPTDALDEFQVAYDAATDRLRELMNGRES